MFRKLLLFVQEERWLKMGLIVGKQALTMESAASTEPQPVLRAVLPVRC